METNYSPENLETESYEIPLGVDDAGLSITWNTLNNPNIIHSASSSSRDDLRGNILGYCYEHPDYWNGFYVVNKAGGLRIKNKPHKGLLPHYLDRKELIDELHLHMASVLETSVKHPGALENQPNHVLFAITDIENLVRHLQQPEIEKLQEILTQGNRAGIHVSWGIGGHDTYKDREPNIGVLKLIEALIDNDESLLVSEGNRESKIITTSGKEIPLHCYPLGYRFTPITMAPKRLSCGKSK